MIPWLGNVPYKGSLKEPNLFRLSKRRMRDDLIEVFNMFKTFITSVQTFCSQLINQI